MLYDVVVIGGGPAGLTAALYSGRSKLKTKVVEKLTCGGQLLLTELIENFPGVYQMNSFNWVEMLKKQIADLKSVEMQEDMVVKKVEDQDGIFKTTVVARIDGSEQVIESHSVIVATGAQPARLGIKGEDAFIGRGVSFCATCDGPLFKDREVVLVGGGDTAIEEALYLSKFAKSITIVHRRDSLRAAAVLQDKVKKNHKIAFRWNALPLEILGTTRVEGIRLKDVKTNEESVLFCEGVFVFIGFTPDTEPFKGFLDLNEGGFIVTDENLMSSCTGIFSCGDCRVRPFKQVVTACSEGAIAAHSAAKFLENKI